MSSTSSSKLFQPLKLGDNTLQHRIALAPLTRNRNDNDHAPISLMETYYDDRASVPGTLIISEATATSHDEEGQRNIPGINTEKQVAAWTKIISRVHAKGSVYFQQLFALGRANTPDYVKERSLPYRSSSDIPLEGYNAIPTPMTEEEIHQTIQDFVSSSKNAIRAGADGVEIHAAHGYLLDQFLSASANKRSDKWGGSVENRSRLTLEVVKAVVAAIGAEKVAIRFSPFAGFQGVAKDDIHELYSYVVEELKKLNAKFAYLSLVEAKGDPAHIVLDADQINKGKTLDFILDAWNNLSPVVVAGGYTPESAIWAVDEHYKKWDVLVAFGRHYLANPDLVYRIQHGLPLNKYNRATFYLVMNNVGYNDYPFSQEFLAAKA
ncbi:hypothetical protein SEUCBS139899_005553 [Sporothrix eucalyptigena]|uniref:NADH:flavin oxidoreductase/NADH oxidase N-terminal domain-containing protein n=1 Tax=Sporothrix eucalyptigena TaxID=1812306 RepID=A0ABP0C0P7_9PEZI